MKSILVTGGCGYIGSHACVALHQAGYQPVILDNLHNSSALVLSRIEALTDTAPIFYLGDIRDSDLLEQIFTQHKIDAVIHFAGLKAVGESVEKPLAYYDNNVNGTLRLVEAMQAHGVNSLIFSSSATVYGDPASVPITENFPTQAMNPYGRSKLMVEECLRDIQHANPAMSITLLRYFNPVGAHESGMMGEDPKGIPNNLMPYIAQVAVGRRSHLSVFGHDYPTVDGTGVRDYIHVVDLVDGHIAALERKGHDAGLHVYNLGTGQAPACWKCSMPSKWHRDAVLITPSARVVPVILRNAGRRPIKLSKSWAGRRNMTCARWRRIPGIGRLLIRKVMKNKLIDYQNNK